MMVGNKIIKHHIESMDSKGVMRTPHALPQKVQTLCKGYIPIRNFSIYALDDSFFGQRRILCEALAYVFAVALLCAVLKIVSVPHIYASFELDILICFFLLYFCRLVFKLNQMVFVVKKFLEFLEIFLSVC